VSEPSVEEIVAEYEARRQTMRTADLVALIADWRNRGEALAQIPALTQEHGGAAKAIKLCRAALKGNGEGK
jgi:hypothetical protein